MEADRDVGRAAGIAMSPSQAANGGEGALFRYRGEVCPADVAVGGRPPHHPFTSARISRTACSMPTSMARATTAKPMETSRTWGTAARNVA